MVNQELRQRNETVVRSGEQTTCPAVVANEMSALTVRGVGFGTELPGGNESLCRVRFAGVGAGSQTALWANRFPRDVRYLQVPSDSRDLLARDVPAAVGSGG